MTDKEEREGLHRKDEGIFPEKEVTNSKEKTIYHGAHRKAQELHRDVEVHDNKDKKNLHRENDSVHRKPYKFNDIKKKEYLKLISEGHTRGYAATLILISRQTVWEHIKSNDEFAKAVSDAESDAVAKIENALFKAAQEGNITAQQVYLYNRSPRRWADRRNIRLAGEGGGPIEVREVKVKGKILGLLASLAASKEKDKKPKPDES